MTKINKLSMQIKNFDLLKNYSIGKRNYKKICAECWKQFKSDIRKTNARYDLMIDVTINDYFKFTICPLFLKRGLSGIGYYSQIAFDCSYYDIDTECDNSLICEFDDMRNRKLNFNECEYEFNRY